MSYSKLQEKIHNAPFNGVGVFVTFFDEIKRFKQTPQDAIYHAEGDVLIHTDMVVQALLVLPEYQKLSKEKKEIAFLSCVLHDIGKPATTKTEESGKITSIGHSKKGLHLARKYLYELNAPFHIREEVCQIIAHHQVPFFVMKKEDCFFKTKKMMSKLDIDVLNMVAKADMIGRTCSTQQLVLDDIELYSEYILEKKDELMAPLFNPYTEFQYMNNQCSHFDQIYFTSKASLHIMSGFSGIGKSTYAQTLDLPIINLDQIRVKNKMKHGDNEGFIIQEALQELKKSLAKGQSVVWDATNLFTDRRSKLVQLAHDYHCDSHIIYIEQPIHQLMEQQKDSDHHHSSVEIFDKWQVPLKEECMHIDYIINQPKPRPNNHFSLKN